MHCLVHQGNTETRNRGASVGEPLAHRLLHVREDLSGTTTSVVRIRGSPGAAAFGRVSATHTSTQEMSSMSY